MYPLMLGKILGVFLNKLTAGGKHPVKDWENWQLPMQTQLSETRRNFSQFFVHYWNLHQILNISKKKDHGQTQCISKITVCEKTCQTTLSKAPFRNTL